MTLHFRKAAEAESKALVLKIFCRSLGVKDLFGVGTMA
jgi:hypothetical protein